jgi:Rrf2 family transcriptional regulator, iron-sulfur cluster assembly transcription factor
MMKLSTRSRYGARMLMDLAEHGVHGPVQVGAVAKRQGISVKYLEKLAHTLKQGGLIKSLRGAKGGHLLARPASDITMGEIVRILEGGLDLVSCSTSRGSCPRLADCPTSRLWQEASQALLEKLDSITLEALTRRVPGETDPVVCPDFLGESE